MISVRQRASSIKSLDRVTVFVFAVQTHPATARGTLKARISGAVIQRRPPRFTSAL
jgi:hypothetical protein